MNVAERRQLHPETDDGKRCIPPLSDPEPRRRVWSFPTCPCDIRYPCPIHDPVLALALDDGDECDS